MTIGFNARVRLAALLALLLAVPFAPPAPAQPAQANPDAAFITVAGPDFAITHVELIDGTGGPPRRDMIVLVRAGRIAAVGARVAIPAGTRIVDGTGKTLVPGFVMMHEHLFYPNSAGDYFGAPQAFARLYLAGGATTIRTGGSVDPYADLAVARAIAARAQVGPDIDFSGPYVDGQPPALARFPTLPDAAAAERLVDYWAAEGATSFKLYEHANRAQLAAAVRRAHAHRIRVTGHICATSYAEAAAAGIDNLEHGFLVPSDFVQGRPPDRCPSWPERMTALNALDPEGPEIGGLIATLIRHNVALTSTQGIAETMGAGLAATDPESLALLTPELRAFHLQAQAAFRASPFGQLIGAFFPRQLAMQRRFVRAGGLLLAGSDPTGAGGVIPGFSSRREFVLLVEGGFTAAEAIRIMTLNGARYLGRDREIGSIEVGKRADLVLLDGSLSADPRAIERIATVFKQGVGYNRAAILAAYRGRIGRN